MQRTRRCVRAGASPVTFRAWRGYPPTSPSNRTLFRRLIQTYLYARHSTINMISLRLGLLFWVFLVHLAGIYLFTGGFLLTRLSLPNFSTCSEENCGVLPTHKRAVVLIIDALRFDFIAPNTPHPPSPFYHNVLTLPQKLTELRHRHSLIFNSYADPPTATMQRIKGITTGSLPTFVDIGNNFGGSSIAEDSIVKQLKLAGKKVVPPFTP